MENLRYNSAFRYIIIFTVIMVLITLPTGISYYMTVKSMESNQEKLNLESVIQIKNIVDERLNEINYIVNNLGTYYKTSYILSVSSDWKDANPKDILTAKEYMDYIGNLQHSTDLVAEISIFSQYSKYVFTSNGVKSFPKWYSSTFSGSNIEGDLWMDSINALAGSKLLTECTYYDNGIPVTIIPYIQKLPLGSRKKSMGYVCLLINKNTLLGWTSEDPGYDNFYIIDAADKIITSLGSDSLDTCKISIPQNTDQGYYTYNHKNSKYIVTYVRSDNGLTYVTLTPYTSVMKQVRYFKKLFTAMVTLSTLLCLIGIIMSIFKIQRPLKHLITYNFKLVNQIQLQESEIKSAILSRLISGTITNYEETEAELLSLKIPVSSKYFCVLKLIIEENFNGNDINVQQKTDTYVAAKTHIKKLADSQNKYILDMEVDSLAIILATDKEEIQNCRLQIGETINTIQKTLETEGLSIYVGGGNFYNNIFDIHASYLEACFALKNAMPKEVSHVFWYDKQDYMPLFFYPQEVEQKMLLSIKRHDEPVIDEILDDLYGKNFCKLKISDSAAEMFLLKLLSTLLLAFSESSCENDELHQKIMSYAFNLQAKQQSYRTLFFPLKGFFKDICQLTKASSTIKSLEMQKNILEFINKHWSEQQMSLTYVSSAFDLSESYLSAMFKEQNNVNFMTYVENKRLEKACELLNNKKKTINEIAYEIGYTSSHSFRRAFKRKYGVTPAYFQANK